MRFRFAVSFVAISLVVGASAHAEFTVSQAEADYEVMKDVKAPNDKPIGSYRELDKGFLSMNCGDEARVRDDAKPYLNSALATAHPSPRMQGAYFSVVTYDAIFMMNELKQYGPSIVGADAHKPAGEKLVDVTCREHPTETMEQVYARVDAVYSGQAQNDVSGRPDFESWKTGGVSASSVSAGTSNQSGLKRIEIQAGENTIADDGSGKTINVFMATRSYTSSYSIIYVATANDPRDGARSSIIGFEKPKEAWTLDNDIEGSPEHGNDAIQSVAFANGTISGVTGLLAIVAHRDWGDTPAYYSKPTFIDIYKITEAEDVGETSPWFHFVKSVPVGKFCSSDVALAQFTKFPLPDDFEGARTKDGCPPTK